MDFLIPLRLPPRSPKIASLSIALDLTSVTLDCLEDRDI